MMLCKIVVVRETLTETEILRFHCFSGHNLGLIPLPSSIRICFLAMEENGLMLMRYLQL